MASTSKGYQWVEILEADSQQIMYANIVTGDCRWEPPENEPYKPNHDNIWWELFDATTQRNYYYNAATLVTLWEKPVGADIVALAKLQEVQEELAKLDAEVADDEPLGFTDEGVAASPEDRHGFRAVATPDSADEEFAEGARMMEAAGRNAPPAANTHHATLQRSRSQDEPFAAPAAARPTPAARIAAGAAMSDSAPVTPTMREVGGMPLGMRATEATVREPPHRVAPVAAPRAAAMISALAAADAAVPPMAKSRSVPAHLAPHRAHPHAVAVVFGPGAGGPPVAAPRRSTEAALRSEAGSRASPSSSPKPTLRARGFTEAALRRPNDPPGFARAPSEEDLTRVTEHLSRHRVGNVFRKRRVSLATMLSWSKDMIPKPMLLTHDRKRRRDALELFKLVQIYMGDRAARQARDDLDVAESIFTLACSTQGLPDELCVQLIKQTTLNHSLRSCELGWELLAMAFSFLIPGVRFFSYVQGYITRHTLELQDGQVGPLAELALRRLERAAAAKRANVARPTRADVEQSRFLIYNPAIFGGTLEDNMTAQAEAYPDLPLPRVLVVLTRTLLSLDAAHTEGLFRVPGDMDTVNAIRTSFNLGRDLPEVTDPHAVGSALKLWVRELEQPLIPSAMYQACLDCVDDVPRALGLLDQLPMLNRHVLFFIIHLLQTFGQPQYFAFTKMSFENFAMVWAPNVLRCPTDDPATLFANAKLEMQFVRLLLNNLETDMSAELQRAPSPVHDASPLAAGDPYPFVE